MRNFLIFSWFIFQNELAPGHTRILRYGPTWDRTRDLPVMSRWLCQLSYGPTALFFPSRYGIFEPKAAISFFCKPQPVMGHRLQKRSRLGSWPQGFDPAKCPEPKAADSGRTRVTVKSCFLTSLPSFVKSKKPDSSLISLNVLSFKKKLPKRSVSSPD